MKKFTKISLIIVAVLAALGILLCGAAAVMGAGAGTIFSMAKAGELDFGDWHIGPYGIYIGDDEDNWLDTDEWLDVDDWFDGADDRIDADDWIGAGDDGRGTAGNAGQTGTENSGSVTDTLARFAVTDVKNLKIDVDAATLYMEESSEAEHITVELNHGNPKNYGCELDGDTLTIGYDIKKYIINNQSAKITVKLPKGMQFETVDLDTGATELIIKLPGLSCETLTADVGAGNLVAEYVEVTGKMDISIGAGNVEIEDGSYGELKLECGMGNIDIDGVLQGDMTAECGMGDVKLELRGRESDYNYELSCGMGELEINDASYSKIGGNKSIKNADAVGTITLECGMGSIELDIEQEIGD